MESAAGSDVTVDAFLDGRVTLLQPRKGHRAGLDAALLQALIAATAEGHAIDLGTGVGTVAFAIAARAPKLRVTGVERDPQLVALAGRALQLPENVAFADRVALVEADVAARRDERKTLGLAEGSADWVLMNPPFDVALRVRASPQASRRSAHIGEADTLDAWCRTAAGLLKHGGALGLIHRAAALADVLAALAGRFGDIRIRPVHPATDAPAGRILVSARRGSRAPLSILPALVLHRTDGGWAAEADAILRGRAELMI